MCRPRRRPPSSDDGLFLPRRRFDGLKKAYGNLAISAQSMSEPKIDDEQSIFRVGAFRRAGEIVSKDELIEQTLTNESERVPGQGVLRIWLRANEVHAPSQLTKDPHSPGWRPTSIEYLNGGRHAGR